MPDPYKGWWCPGERELDTLYAVKEEIGRGGFGVVFSAERKSDYLSTIPPSSLHQASNIKM